MTGRNAAPDSTPVTETLPSAGQLILRLAGILIFALSTLLLYWSIRIAWSDWLSRDRTRESILKAIDLLPENSLYYRFWAEIEPKDGVIALRQAAAINPLNPDIRIELGIHYEQSANLPEAESSLL